MRLRSALLTTAACLTAAVVGAPVAGAAGPPVLGPADGVQATVTGQTLEVRFTGTAATVAKIGGRTLDVSCGVHPSPVGLQFVGDKPAAIGSGTATAQGVLQVRLDRAVPIDACEIEGTEEGPVQTVARAALDPAGAAWIDESARAPALVDLLGRARSATAYRPAGSVLFGTVVAMDGPSATPPLGRIGYWTDATGTTATAATMTAAGRRLVVQDLGGGMLRTNVIDQAGVLDGLLDAAFEGPEPPELDRGDADGKLGKPSPYRAGPVEPRDGVRARFAGRRLTIRFTGRSAAAFRGVAGRRVTVTCLRRPAAALFGGAVKPLRLSAAVVRVPTHGGTLTATLSPGDACTVRDDSTAVALALATDAGRRWWADVQAVGLSDKLPGSLAAAGGTTYLPAATVAAQHPDLTALASPGAAVPRGSVGVWTDGAHQALVAIESTSGRRYVLADEGDGMVRTNIYADVVGLLFFDSV